MEYRGKVVRIWTDGEDEATPPSDRAYVDIDRPALPDLLRSAQYDLVGFLRARRDWTEEIAPEHADRLVVALDAKLQISEPLPL
ncbi:hypothetical protein [Micromonospora sp. NPDC005367]|uniref:hypothetical protein n=1 Tax=Micromonospora sp. NPDC005367 TaxID=3155590 RepID=UPI0033A18D38